jgi:hypothetical protein
VKNTKIVFAESFARVTGLSLSGKILLPFVDKFFVQWPELKAKYPKTHYIGMHHLDINLTQQVNWRANMLSCYQLQINPNVEFSLLLLEALVLMI